MKNTNKRANGELVKTLLCLVTVLAISIPAYSRGGKMMEAKPFVKWAGGKGQLIEQLGISILKFNNVITYMEFRK